MIRLAALVNLNIEGSFLVYAGLGYQPDADFPKDSNLGEALLPCGDKYLEVCTEEGVFLVKHGDYYEVE